MKYKLYLEFGEYEDYFEMSKEMTRLEMQGISTKVIEVRD